MNTYAGKVRIGVIAIYCAAALAIAGLHGSPGRAQPTPTPTPTLFVANACTAAVTAYPAASNGDVSPLPPVPTGLAAPAFVAIDASGNIYVTNRCNGTITIYAKGSSGDAAPIAIIGGSNTGLTGTGGIALRGIALDSSGNIYVVNGESVFVYAAGSNGNVAPIATISGGNTGLTGPTGIALDSRGNIYVADQAFGRPHVGAVLVYAAGANGNVAPVATISGSYTDLEYPYGIALDSSGDIYVADNTYGLVLIYPPLGSSTGLLNEGPLTIGGSNSGMTAPTGIALDSSGNIYVTSGSVVFVFPSPFASCYPERECGGNEAPIATISGSNTGLSGPDGITLDSSGNIYVADSGDSSVTVYPPLASLFTQPDYPDETPIAAISTTMTTGLEEPTGIALDYSGNIYVTDLGNMYYGGSIPPSVFVYPAGSNGSVAPIATISGSNTGLYDPRGIALDHSGNIYVADQGDSPPITASVFVYPAGSNGNAAPVATITGSNTMLVTPAGRGGFHQRQHLCGG